MSTPERTKPRIYAHSLFCESVIRDTADRLTAVRMASGYIANPIRLTPNLPDGTPDPQRTQLIYMPIHVTAVISFYSEQRADFTVTLKAILPSGGEMETTAPPIPAHLEGGVTGLTLNTEIKINPEEDGVYWFEIYVDGELATKTPFRITRAPIEGPESSHRSAPPGDQEPVHRKPRQSQNSE